MSKFSVNLTQNQLRQMNADTVKARLIEAAHEQIARKDLTGVQKFLVPHYPQRQLCEWAKEKFGVEPDAEKLAGLTREEVGQELLGKAREAYIRREVEYPVEFALEWAFTMAQQDGPRAVQQLCGWVRQRYGLEWQPEQVTSRTRGQLAEELNAVAREWLQGGKLEALIDQGIAQHGDAESLAKWASERFARPVKAEELADPLTRRDVLIRQGRAFLRSELTQLERYVLLQILDDCWKSHLYAMDQLRDTVSMRNIADRERDPRVVYKREGAGMFVQMQQLVRHRVTNLIFRAKLTPQVEMRNVYTQQEAAQEEAPSAVDSRSPRGSAEQEADLDAAERTGGDRDLSRKQRRAAVADARRKGGRDGRRRR